jgi:hypothetical protein
MPRAKGRRRVLTGVNHGTYNSYRKGCRCSICTTFIRECAQKLRGIPQYTKEERTAYQFKKLTT